MDLAKYQYSVNGADYPFFPVGMDSGYTFGADSAYPFNYQDAVNDGYGSEALSRFRNWLWAVGMGYGSEAAWGGDYRKIPYCINIDEAGSYTHNMNLVVESSNDDVGGSMIQIDSYSCESKSPLINCNVVNNNRIQVTVDNTAFDTYANLADYIIIKALDANGEVIQRENPSSYDGIDFMMDVTQEVLVIVRPVNNPIIEVEAYQNIFNSTFFPNTVINGTTEGGYQYYDVNIGDLMIPETSEVISFDMSTLDDNPESNNFTFPYNEGSEEENVTDLPYDGIFGIGVLESQPGQITLSLTKTQELNPELFLTDYECGEQSLIPFVVTDQPGDYEIETDEIYGSESNYSIGYSDLQGQPFEGPTISLIDGTYPLDDGTINYDTGLQKVGFFRVNLNCPPIPGNLDGTTDTYFTGNQNEELFGQILCSDADDGPDSSNFQGSYELESGTTEQGNTVSLINIGGNDFTDNFKYTPREEFTGLDAFKYRCVDSQYPTIKSEYRQVNIYINDTINDPPFFTNPEQDFQFDIDEGSQSISRLYSCQDPDIGQPLYFSLSYMGNEFTIGYTETIETLFGQAYLDIPTTEAGNSVVRLNYIIRNENAYGRDQFLINCQDYPLLEATDGLRDTKQITINVNPVNDPPIITPIDDKIFLEDARESRLTIPIEAFGGVNELQALTITAESDDINIDTQVLNIEYFERQNGKTTATLSLTMPPHYETQTQTANGYSTITLTATERLTIPDIVEGEGGAGLSSSIQFKVTIIPVGDPSVIESFALNINEDQRIFFGSNETDFSLWTTLGEYIDPTRNTEEPENINLDTYHSDVDNQTVSDLNMRITKLPIHGTLIYQENGIVTELVSDGTLPIPPIIPPFTETNSPLIYRPNPNFNGVDEIHFQMVDLNEGDVSNTSIITINLAPIDDAPEWRLSYQSGSPENNWSVIPGVQLNDTAAPFNINESNGNGTFLMYGGGGLLDYLRDADTEIETDLLPEGISFEIQPCEVISGEYTCDPDSQVHYPEEDGGRYLLAYGERAVRPTNQFGETFDGNYKNWDTDDGELAVEASIDNGRLFISIGIDYQEDMLNWHGAGSAWRIRPISEAGPDDNRIQAFGKWLFVTVHINSFNNPPSTQSNYGSNGIRLLRHFDEDSSVVQISGHNPQKITIPEDYLGSIGDNGVRLYIANGNFNDLSEDDTYPTDPTNQLEYRETLEAIDIESYWTNPSWWDNPGDSEYPESDSGNERPIGLINNVTVHVSDTYIKDNEVITDELIDIEYKPGPVPYYDTSGELIQGGDLESYGPSIIIKPKQNEYGTSNFAITIEDNGVFRLKDTIIDGTDGSDIVSTSWQNVNPPQSSTYNFQVEVKSVIDVPDFYGDVWEEDSLQDFSQNDTDALYPYIYLDTKEILQFQSLSVNNQVGTETELVETIELGCAGVDPIKGFLVKYPGSGNMYFNGETALGNISLNKSDWLPQTEPSGSNQENIYNLSEKLFSLMGGNTNFKYIPLPDGDNDIDSQGNELDAPAPYNYSKKIKINYTPNPLFFGRELFFWTCTSAVLDPNNNNDFNGSNVQKFTVGLEGWEYGPGGELENDGDSIVDYDFLQRFMVMGLNVAYSESNVNFGYDDNLDINIEQTLLNKHNPLSGISVINDGVKNDEDIINAHDLDKRPSLGMFYYGQDNPLKDNFPDGLNEPFTQIPKINYVQNPGGRFELTQAKLLNFISDEVYFKDDSNPLSIPEDDFSNHIDNILSNIANSEGRNLNTIYFPEGGWSYINLDGRYINITETNKPSDSAAPKHQQYSDGEINGGIVDETRPLYNGFVPYHSPFVGSFNLMSGYKESTFSDNASTSYQFEWAKWIKDSECHSFGKCLQFSASSKWDTMDFYDNLPSTLNLGQDLQVLDGYVDEFPGNYGTVNGDLYDLRTTDTFYDEYIGMFGEGKLNQNQYRTINQAQHITDVDNFTPYSSVKVSFWMKTLEAPNQEKGFPKVHIGIKKGEEAIGYKYWWTNQPYHGNHNDIEEIRNVNNPGYSVYNGRYNSFKHTDIDTTEGDGSFVRFQNSQLNKWEQFEFTFVLSQQYINAKHTVNPFSLMVEAGNDFEGVVLTDDFSVTEAYDFIPDADVRMKKADNEYGNGVLTEYYDPSIPEQFEKYQDTVAPLEAAFYFYPRYNSANVFGQEKNILFNDFRNGLFYIQDVDWGDGTSREYTSEPLKLGDDIMLFHTYEKAGIYEVTGTMIRMKSDFELQPLGVIFNSRFTLRININEGLDEDFQYLGGEGFSFIPYKDTTPIIGGYSENSLYYKSIKRQLGFITDDVQSYPIFEKQSDKLKTEFALQKMDSNFNLPLLNEFKKPRYELQPEFNFIPLEYFLNEKVPSNNSSEHGWFMSTSHAFMDFTSEFTPKFFEDGSYGVNVRYEIDRQSIIDAVNNGESADGTGNAYLFLGYSERVFQQLDELGLCEHDGVSCTGGTEFTYKMDIRFNETTDNGPGLQFRPSNMKNDFVHPQVTEAQAAEINAEYSGPDMIYKCFDDEMEKKLKTIV